MTQAATLQQPDILPEKIQQQASDPAASVWVNASAGSGKTTILTNRVIRLLLQGVPPQKILCLTFTRAAAAEMASRINEKLSTWATCTEDDLRKSLDELQDEEPAITQLNLARTLFAYVIACPGGMRIRTIHSFCQEILGRFPIEAGLPPHFTVIEETDRTQLLNDIQAEVLQDITTTENHHLSPSLSTIATGLGETSFDKALKSFVEKSAQIEQAAHTFGGVDEVIHNIRAELELCPEDSKESLIRAAVDDQNFPVDELRMAAKTVLEKCTKKFTQHAESQLEFFAAAVDKRIILFEKYQRSFLTGEQELRKQFMNDEVGEDYPDLNEVCHQEALRLQKLLQKLDNFHIACTTEALLRIGGAIIARYKTRKRSIAALDYSDMINHTRDVLTHKDMAAWVLYKLDEGIDHILVDESQDTSPAQWDIIAALSDEFFAGHGAKEDQHRTLFVVGDEKQSIYSFQGADPDVFQRKRRDFSQQLIGVHSQLRQLSPNISFRSAPAILNAVDAIFAQDNARVGVAMEPTKHYVAAPRNNKPPKIGHVEIWNLCANTKTKKDSTPWIIADQYSGEDDPERDLAEQIAVKIKTLCRDEVFPDTGERIQPADIMILLRKRGSFASTMVRALKRHGVPVTGVDQMRLMQQLSVMDALALVRFVLLPDDDLNLATIVRGPLLNKTEDDLMKIAIGRSGTLWENLQLNTDFADCVIYLSEKLRVADATTPFAFIAGILNEPCPSSVISGRHALWARLGVDALDPLDELLNEAEHFGQRHAPSLQNFLHWIETADKTIKREMDKGSGQVRLMTVHGAKGLEAPIVFLPDTNSIPRTQDVPNLLWSSEGLPFYTTKIPKGGVAARLWSDARNKQMDEYRRLFYVALTRAINRIYICGWEPNRTEKTRDNNWYHLALSGLQPLNQMVATQDPMPLVHFADSPTTKPLTLSRQRETINQLQIEDWLRRKVLDEENALENLAAANATPATASPDYAFARGRIIHRMLQSLPDIVFEKRAAVAARFLANPQLDLKGEQQDEIAKEVLALLHHPDHAALFGMESRAEVPLAGIINDRTVSRQVDRLCLVDNQVWIVDYKTNRPPPLNKTDTPRPYRQQLAEYRALLREIYPNRAVRCFLLWTYAPALVELEDADLQGILPC
jgi:ATP-dependent helicase/nuclease subunit A